MLTLALTWTVPLTEEPGAGDVMVTIRLPPGSGSGGNSCANAWGAIQAKPKTINRAAAQTFLFVFFSVERASISTSLPFYPSRRELRYLPVIVQDDQFGSRDDIKRIHQDPEIGRKRVLAYHLDRQGMSAGSQATSKEVGAKEVGVLGAFRLEVRIEVLDEGSIQEDAGDPGLRSAGADPADPRAGEGDGRLRAHRIGFRGGSLTVCLVPIVLNPIRAVGDGRIGILVARSRHRHLEGVHHDEGRSRERVLVAGHFDRQGMARVGQALLREYFRLDLFRGRIRIDQGATTPSRVTRAIPVWGPRAPIQLIPVPVKLMVACAPGVVESVAIPALHARLVLNGIQSGAATVPAV